METKPYAQVRQTVELRQEAQVEGQFRHCPEVLLRYWPPIQLVQTEGSLALQRAQLDEH